jgi:hypothetical protein
MDRAGGWAGVTVHLSSTPAQAHLQPRSLFFRKLVHGNAGPAPIGASELIAKSPDLKLFSRYPQRLCITMWKIPLLTAPNAVLVRLSIKCPFREQNRAPYKSSTCMAQADHVAKK